MMEVAEGGTAGHTSAYGPGPFLCQEDTHTRIQLGHSSALKGSIWLDKQSKKYLNTASRSP